MSIAHLCQPNRRQRILAALKRGPMTIEQLAVAADTSGQGLHDGVLDRLVDEGRIVMLGTARELGIKSRMDAKVYALPGTEKPKPPAPKAKTRGEVAGPITIRGYRWGGKYL